MKRSEALFGLMKDRRREPKRAEQDSHALLKMIFASGQVLKRVAPGNDQRVGQVRSMEGLEARQWRRKLPF